MPGDEPATETPCAVALFRNGAELDRLARLKLDDPAAFEAEKAALKARQVPARALDAALGPRLVAPRVERRDATPTSAPVLSYFVRDGMTYRTAATREGSVDVALCNFAATITAVVTRDDGAETLRLFTLEGRYVHRGGTRAGGRTGRAVRGDELGAGRVGQPARGVRG
jgi:hypothetical protein